MEGAIKDVLKGDAHHVKRELDCYTIILDERRKAEGKPIDDNVVRYRYLTEAKNDNALLVRSLKPKEFGRIAGAGPDAIKTAADTYRTTVFETLGLGPEHRGLLKGVGKRLEHLGLSSGKKGTLDQADSAGKKAALATIQGGETHKAPKVKKHH